MEHALEPRRWLCLLFIAAIGFFGCNAEEKHWKEVQDLGTIEAFKGYLEQFPEARHKEEAKQAIQRLEDEFERAKEEVDWQAAISDGTVEAYESFLNAYPTGVFAEQAAVRLKELAESIAWEKAQESDSISAYRTFLAGFPESRYSEKARDQLKRLYTPTEQAMMNAIGRAAMAEWPHLYHPGHSQVGVELKQVRQFDETLGYIDVVAGVSVLTGSTLVHLAGNYSPNPSAR